MKWTLVAIFGLVAFASPAFAEEELPEDGDARLGFITVGTDGSTSVTFNATSIQNAVILGLFLLVLGALLLPLFGAFGEEESGYGYGYDQTSGSGYEVPSSGYNTYSKRYAALIRVFSNFAAPKELDYTYDDVVSFERKNGIGANLDGGHRGNDRRG